jgi:hypothetical protein
MLKIIYDLLLLVLVSRTPARVPGAPVLCSKQRLHRAIVIVRKLRAGQREYPGEMQATIIVPGLAGQI